ncbi:hypothetical protein [Sulfobacillus thermosulfidooxidans]|uniref:hypothetical protein n=1 Tax=Sulfobacillus thermosulfidooxidans TaxID=28034 RepID=UPI000424F6E9|nr:hypothetical protein [Sulfobacillus thermosulfidooxidans]
MGLWLIVRIFSLSGERMVLTALGRHSDPWGIMGASSVMAALFLWLGVFLQHQPLTWLWPILWPSMVYAAAFSLYTWALSKGPISEVSPWSNATTLLLFLWHPGLSQGIGFIASFAIGAWLAGAQSLSLAGWVMLASDVFFAAGRLLDVHYRLYSPLTYGANLMTWVSLWILSGLALSRGRGKILSTVKNFPVLSTLEGFFNALSYVSVIMLLRQMPVAIIEAVSSIAGLLAALGGFIFHEQMTVRQILGAFIMSASAFFLLLTQSPITLNSKWDMLL